MNSAETIRRVNPLRVLDVLHERRETLEIADLPVINLGRTLALWVMLLALLTPRAFSQTWIRTSAPTNSWRSIAASADGIRLMAVSGGNLGVGLIYASTNSGITWNATSAPDKYWSTLASSADGTKLLALGSDYMFITNGT